LTDNNNTNDSFDMIYIKNPYSLITEENNLEEIGYNDLYVFGSSLQGKNIQTIYPFISSNKCCLSFNTNYYL